MTQTPDSIEKTAIYKAPLARVWSAVSDARQFGSWFGMRFDGPFIPGQAITGTIAPTTVDPEVAKLQEPHAGKRFEFQVGNIAPGRSIEFRWHPFAIDPAHDYSAEPMTKIVFALQEVQGGTRLTITETGFGAIPAARRAQAYAANEGGWEHQCRLLGKYLELKP